MPRLIEAYDDVQVMLKIAEPYHLESEVFGSFLQAFGGGCDIDQAISFALGEWDI